MSQYEPQEPKPFSYATQKFTPIGLAGAGGFAVSSFLTPILYYQHLANLGPYGDTGFEIPLIAAGAAWVVSIPAMLVGRGFIYTTEPPLWSQAPKLADPTAPKPKSEAGG